MQLDIFAHSRDVVLRNDLIEALLAHDVSAAERSLLALAEELPGDPALEDGRALTAALLETEAQASPAPFSRIDDAAAAAAALHGDLAAAAGRLLPRGSAAAWLAPHWVRLARRAARLPYANDGTTAMATGHAVALWLRAAEWAAAADAVAAGIESWRRIPQTLAWMTEARHRQQGLDATWPQWVELAWLAPRRFAELAAHIADRPLDKLMQRYELDFESDSRAAVDTDWAWFPAWCLVDSPSLATVMDGATASVPSEPARAWSLLQSLLRLERQGRHHEIVKARATLRECHGGLFALYMRTR